MIDKDDFWDLSSLIPPKKTHTSFIRADEPVTITEKREEEPETAETKLTLGTEPEKTDCEEYSPQNNPLILQVKIRRSSLPYRFYHQFK
ncbi:MAG: hypothetical protein MJ078_07880, partial [Clostridia bacterium]|nr:hypothetical protein [Clostridia bacterium]